ncbi:MAG: FumA C-terminus/TtdB family hydratase beta subunit [Candidatus Methanofastidiosia archaeon]
MVEEKHLKLPLSEEEVRALDLGDVLYLSGIIYTARDEAHMRALEFLRRGRKLPVELKGYGIFHCGPLMRKNGEWEVVAAGPTTSSRMNLIEPEFLERSSARAIIGKGGMSKPTVEAMQKNGACYFSITGGAAVLAAAGIKKVLGVHWLDLGMPEALWVFETENFGPLICAIDAKGNSLYERVKREVDVNVSRIRENL